VLQDIVRDAIDDVIDRDTFNEEADQMKDDSARLVGLRETVFDLLKKIDFSEDRD
jgi:hypothetical protein